MKKKIIHFDFRLDITFNQAILLLGAITNIVELLGVELTQGFTVEDEDAKEES